MNNVPESSSVDPASPTQPFDSRAAKVKKAVLQTTFALVTIGPNLSFGIARGTVALTVHAISIQRFNTYGQTLDNIHSQPDNIQESRIYKKFCQHLNRKPENFDANLDDFHKYVEAKKDLSEIKILQNKKLLKSIAISMVPFLELALASKIFSAEKPDQAYSPIEATTTRLLEPAQKAMALLLFPLSFSSEGFAKTYKIEFDKGASNAGFERSEIAVNTPLSKRTIETWEGMQDDDKERIQKGQPPQRPTVVIFHANAVTGSFMRFAGNHYFRKGYNVLMPTIGGYPGSPGVQTSEGSIYQDIEAIKIHLAKQGVTKVAFHGLSLGGALAIHAASTDNPKVEVSGTSKEMETLFVIADQTFTSASEVAGNLIANTIGKSLASVARGVMNAGVPKKEPILLPSGTIVYSNGLDSKAKMPSIKEKKIPIHFIAASNDAFMGLGTPDSKGRYPTDYAHEMSNIVYPGDNTANHVITLGDAEHATLFVACEEVIQVGNFTRKFAPDR